MNTTSNSLYQKVTLTLPRVVVHQLQSVPKGRRSGLVADAVLDALKLRKLKMAVESLRKM